MGRCGDAVGCSSLHGMPETELYPTVKRFLEAAGFQVKGEVEGCDVVAVRDGHPQRLVIAEMKLGFNLPLLLQAVDRMRAADEVWLVVPASRRGRDRDPRVHRLCRLIGIGLMAVDAAHDGVEVLADGRRHVLLSLRWCPNCPGKGSPTTWSRLFNALDAVLQCGQEVNRVSREGIGPCCCGGSIDVAVRGHHSGWDRRAERMMVLHERGAAVGP